MAHCSLKRDNVTVSQAYHIIGYKFEYGTIAMSGGILPSRGPHLERWTSPTSFTG